MLLVRHARRCDTAHPFHNVVNQQLQRDYDADVQESGLQSDKETLDAAFRLKNIVDDIARPSPIVLVSVHQA